MNSSDKPPIILASSSPYRRELLARLGLFFSTQSPEVEESRLDSESPAAMAMRLAEEKARDVASRAATALVIASDQVAVLDQELVGKPGTFERAKTQLLQASGRTLSFYTALCVLNGVSGRCHVDMVSCEVTFRKLSTAEIEDYLHREQPYDCAGAFKSEGLGIALLTGIHGNDPTALIGLPLIRLCEMLRLEGVGVLGPP